MRLTPQMTVDFRVRVAIFALTGHDMKNLYDLLRQKELGMKRLEKEIEAIRIVISMLSEDGEQPEGADIKQAIATTTAALNHANATPAAGGTYSAVQQNAPAETPKLTRNWP